ILLGAAFAVTNIGHTSPSINTRVGALPTDRGTLPKADEALSAGHYLRFAAAPAPNRRGQTDRNEAGLTIADFSVVEVRTTAVHNARGSGVLGPRRQGGGIVIDDNGLVLTAAYLVTETEKIEIVGTNQQV